MPRHAQAPAATPVYTPVATIGPRDDDENGCMTAHLPDHYLPFSLATRRIDPYLAYFSMTIPSHPLGHSHACTPTGSHALTPGHGRTSVPAPVCAQETL